MKMKYTIILSFLLLTWIPSLKIQAAPTYCLEYAITSLTATQVVVKISMTGQTAFKLGDANLALNFNANALSAPSLVSTALNGFYSPTTVTNPASGLASINIDFNGVTGQGIDIATTTTEVARIQFTINNSNLTTGFSINPTYCVAYNDAVTLLDIGSGCPGLDVVLPLEWLDFQAKATTEKGIKRVSLEWLTASEQNVQHFIVERSQDGKTFEKIGTPVLAKNKNTAKNNYQVFDLKPLLDISFYRIQEISFSGQTSFSTVRTVVLTDEKTAFTILPNPKPKESPLSIQTNWTENYIFNVFDARGKLVYTRLCKGSIELYHLDLPSSFYIYECVMPQEKVTGKLIIP